MSSTVFSSMRRCVCVLCRAEAAYLRALPVGGGLETAKPRLLWELRVNESQGCRCWCAGEALAMLPQPAAAPQAISASPPRCTLLPARLVAELDLAPQGSPEASEAARGDGQSATNKVDRQVARSAAPWQC